MKETPKVNGEVNHQHQQQQLQNSAGGTSISTDLPTLTSLPRSYATQLFDAMDDTDLAAVNAILDKHPEAVRERDDEGRVSLHYAADSADPETFLRILNLDPLLIDAEDSAGLTPLLVAVMGSHLDVVRLLLGRKANVSHRDADKHSAVHWAVVCAELEALTMLLESEAPFDTADVYGARPLHYATALGVEEEGTLVGTTMIAERAQSILLALLRAGAEVNSRDSDGRTPLLWAASNGNLEAFRSLVQAGADKHATDRDRLGILHCAASNGHVEIIERMLASSHHGIIESRDRNGDTPLFYAATFGHYECARLLLESGADPNHMDRRLRTAAHCAAAKGHLRVLCLLKRYGASFEFQNYRGDLPFHEAVQTGSRELVDWLLQVEPRFLSTPNFYGRTALHLAAAAGNMELVVFLTNRGGRINPLVLYHDELYTPLDLALERDHPAVADYLRARYGALRAGEMPLEKTAEQRANIDEQVKTAKLRKARAQFQSSEVEEEERINDDGGYSNEEGGSEAFEAANMRAGLKSNDYADYGRRVKKRSAKYQHSPAKEEGLENEDASPLSRRSSSASELRGLERPHTMLAPARQKPLQSRFEKGGAKAKIAAKRDVMKSTTTPTYVGHVSHSEEQEEQEDQKAGENHLSEHELVQETIVKIVREELKKVASATEMLKATSDLSASERLGTRHTSTEASIESQSGRGSGGGKWIGGNAEVTRAISGINGESIESKRREKSANSLSHARSDKEGSNGDRAKEEPRGQRQKVVRVVGGSEYAIPVGKPERSRIFRTSGKTRNGTHAKEEQTSELAKDESGEKEDDEEKVQAENGGKTTDSLELRVVEDGWQPPHENGIRLGESAAERRYVHEKSIFEELTHLKRMQIQYGKVQEGILVRSLISNFCKMHALNPAHFRYSTFYEWEKFLYDQLKMIYLKERGRIQAAAMGGGTSHFTLSVVGAGGSTKRSGGGSSGRADSFGVGSSSRLATSHSQQRLRFEGPKLARPTPLDERLRELAKVYGHPMRTPTLSVRSSDVGTKKFGSGTPTKLKGCNRSLGRHYLLD